jgi:hypothetical protein
VERVQYFIILPENETGWGIFYFADRRINVSLSISAAVHESAFVALSVGRGEECPQKDRYCWQISWHCLLIPALLCSDFFFNWRPYRDETYTRTARLRGAVFATLSSRFVRIKLSKQKNSLSDNYLVYTL